MILPLRTGNSPMMLSIVVVLPAPLRPTSTTASPSRTLSDTPLRTCADPRKALIRSSSSMVLRSQKICGDQFVVSDLVGRTAGHEPALVHAHQLPAVI